MQRWEQAVEEYRQILQHHPDHFESRLSIARIRLAHLNQVDEAQHDFEACLALRPDDVNANLGLAECERRLANSPVAEARLRSLLSRNVTPDQKAGIQVQLGQILFERQDLEGAIQLLTEVITAEPLNGAAHYTLGLAHAAHGDREEAERLFARSKVLEEQFNRLTDITTVLATQPARIDLRYEAGQILMNQGMHAEGAAWMSTVLMIDPDHQPTHAALADYYETVRHDPKLAALHRAKAREAAPKNDAPEPGPTKG